MDRTKIYDYNGPIMDIAPFWDYLQVKAPQLCYQYRVVGAKDQKVKEQTKPIVVEMYEDAINRGLFPARLMPFVKERLQRDVQEGYAPSLFTTASLERITAETTETGIFQFFGQIITLDDLLREAGLNPKTTKEDPAAYAAMIRMLNRSFGSLETYVDDSKQRVLAAIKANQAFAEQQRIKRLFVFDPKAKARTEQEGYTLINSIMDVE